MEKNHESELVNRFRKGDRQAFADLVNMHQRRIHTHLYRWVGSREAAEEMTQEVFLRAYAQIGKFRGEAKFSTWLFQIALNLARDHWRSQQRCGEKLSGEFPLEASSPSFEESLARGQESRRLRRALESLPEIYREALALRYFSELSLEEISALQGQGLSNVKMRIARGLSHLRKKWEEFKNES